MWIVIVLILVILATYVIERLDTPPAPPSLDWEIFRDECNRPALRVRAGSYREVQRLTEGTTPQGEVTEVHTKVAPGVWEIHIEDWQTRDLRKRGS